MDNKHKNKEKMFKAKSANSSKFGQKKNFSRKPTHGYGSQTPYFINGEKKKSFGGNSFSRPNSNGGGNRFGGGNRNNRRNRGESIDISKFVNKAVVGKEEKKVEIINAFADFDLCDGIKNNLKKKSYVTPTPIQDQSINHIIEGRDIIGLAKTGTGKTAAFLLPLINKVFKDRSQKVLIIAPTRELAQQIENEFREFSWDMKIFSAICVGGMPIFKQIQNLKRNPSFVIGTPGRLKDLSERNLVKFENFQNIVLDEVDRMLDMGFVDEIKLILERLPQNKQSLFFSATMPDKIRDLVSKFLNNPITIEIKSNQTTNNIEQDIINVRDKSMKVHQLKQLLNQPELKKVLIFSETKRDVEKLCEGLSQDGFKAESIHGDKKQSQRQRALRMFKDDQVDILVATDVAARGLDIPDVTHVINYTVPQTYDDYIHRIGRTGRGNKSGAAFTFVEAR